MGCFFYITISMCVKTHVQTLNLIDASIKRTISGQSTHMVKGCIDIMFDMVANAFRYLRVVIVCWFLQESSKVKESSLHEIWNADTVLSGKEMKMWFNWQRTKERNAEN